MTIRESHQTMDDATALRLFRTGVEQMLPDPNFRHRFEAAARLSSTAPGAAQRLPLQKDVARSAAPRGGTVCRVFWWGFHIQISHRDLQSFLAGATSVNSLVGMIGGGIPSPAAPWIALAAAFVDASLGLLRTMDRGRGVYISMSWFQPGIFVPTGV